MTLPLWILALLSIAIGVMFTFHHPEPEFESPAWLTPLAVGVALSGVALAWLTYQRGTISASRLAAASGPLRTAALHAFWIDDAFLFVYRSGLLVFSRTIGWIDRYIVDGVVNVFSAWTVMGGGRLRRMQTGKVQDYVFGVAVGVVALLLWLGGVK
jgi:NADH-quinone oxidoreductase subunit L